MKKFLNIFNSFTLKIIAMVTMAIDHFGVVYATFWASWTDPKIYDVCRHIGRIAMPLYCFMIVEGVLHTRSYKKYAIKLGTFAFLVSAFLAITSYVPQLGLTSLADFGNIFLDLLLGSFMIYCLNHKKPLVKLLAVIPIGIAIFSFVAKGIEAEGSCYLCGSTLTYLWYPAFLRLQYDWLSIGLILGFYLSYLLTKLIYKIREEQFAIPYSEEKDAFASRYITNVIAIIFLVGISFLYYSMTYIKPSYVFWNTTLQLYAIMAGVFILLYNGKRGYNAKWFNYFEYMYYPLHIALIYGVYYLIYMLLGG